MKDSKRKEQELSNELILPNKHKFEVIQGDKPDPILKTNYKPPTGSDWLTSLSVGTTFLSRNRQRTNGILDMWSICIKEPNSIKLFTELNQQMFVWVDPKEFCSYNILHHILEAGIEDGEGQFDPS